MNPYTNLDKRAFWAPAVANRNMFDISELWSPKYDIKPSDGVATYGSCFAQHFGRALHERGFNWLISEQAPLGLTEQHAKNFNYGVFSARTGNIYTVSLLRQWVSWACGDTIPPNEIWEKDGRFFDPFRPVIEPGGFASKEEILRSRDMAIESFRDSILSAKIFVFTLGLTESWFNRRGKYEYPMCPGTAAGEFDESRHEFFQQNYVFILENLTQAIEKIRTLNPEIKFLLTVSPVPLTATKSGNHVLVATMESKSILRAVAGQVAREIDYVDYFPSYEIVSSTPFRGVFFEANQRSVNHVGVNHVMSCLFTCLKAAFPDVQSSQVVNRRQAMKEKRQRRIKAREEKGTAPKQAATRDDVVCEEELLDAFSR